MTHSIIADFWKIGPIVDSASPYSAVGEMKLHTMEKKLIHLPMIESKEKQLAKYET